MKPKNLLFSPLSTLLTISLLSILGAAIWIQGGMAFSPGKVTAQTTGQSLGGYGSHAEFETRCALCHPSPGQTQPDLCNECHTDIAAEIEQPSTMHGSLPAGARCFDCHPEHKGKDFDPVDFALRNFDHNQTHFPLDGEHADLACADCHADGTYAALAPECSGCHTEPADHPATVEVECSACHSTQAWLPATFDHQAASTSDCSGCHTSDLPADHYAGQCSACHSTQAWEPASFDHEFAQATDCQACHMPPPAHFSGQCSLCHSTMSWSEVTFSHIFPIDHGDANGECAACHPAGNESWTCFTCHDQGEMNREHAEVLDFSSNCLACHPDGSENGEGEDHGDGGDDD